MVALSVGWSVHKNALTYMWSQLFVLVIFFIVAKILTERDVKLKLVSALWLTIYITTWPFLVT